MIFREIREIIINYKFFIITLIYIIYYNKNKLNKLKHVDNKTGRMQSVWRLS